MGAPPLVVHRVAETASTMDDARALALAGAPAGACVRADRQTGGRGRDGRAWASPAGGIWFSLVLRPRAPPRLWGALPLAAGCAVADAVSAAGAPARIKWPNDVRVAGRKIAGVLVEARAPEFAIVGCGVNVGVSTDALPRDLQANATALLLPVSEVDRVFERIARGILARAATLDEEGSAPILAEWRARSETLGARIERGAIAGIAEDVAEDGALLVRGTDGKLARVVEAE